MTQYKVKVAQSKQQQTSVSFLPLQHSAMQANEILTLKIPQATKSIQALCHRHCAIGTVSFCVSASESARH